MDIIKEITKTAMQISLNKSLYSKKMVTPEQYKHADAVLHRRLTELRESDTIGYSEVM